MKRIYYIISALFLAAAVFTGCSKDEIEEKYLDVIESDVDFQASGGTGVISLSTNDALGMNLKNIGILLNTKNIYFVPFGQDNYKSKPNSMIAKMELLPETIELAMQGKQLQPILQNPV